METIDRAAPPVGPEKVMEIAAGFMAAKHLFTACELGLFQALADGPVSIEEAATRLDLDGDRLRVVADANVALGFLESGPYGYSNSPVAQTYLSGQSHVDLSPLLRFWNRFSYPMWTRMEQTVRTGEANTPDFGALDPETQRVFSHGVEAITHPTALGLAAVYDFGRHRHVLDLGGGTGSFLLAILERHPHLNLTLFELPGAATVARTRLASQPIDVIAGDMFQDVIPTGQDVVILANVVHIFGPQRNVELLRTVRQSLQPGNRVLLVDFWLDPTRTSPAIGALIGGEFMTISGEGRSYAAEEAVDWLTDSCFRFVEQVALGGPQSLIVGEAV